MARSTARADEFRPYTIKKRWKRMSADDFAHALVALGLNREEFSRITGSNEKRIGMWLKGEEPPPPHIPVFCSVLTVPGALDMARRVADWYEDLD